MASVHSSLPAKDRRCQLPSLKLVLRLAILVVFPGQAIGGITFSALESDHWVVHYQNGPGQPAVRVDPTPDEDQTSVRLSGDGGQLAFETPAGVVKVFRRDPDSGKFTLMQTIPTAARPVWHPGLTNWAFVRYTVTASGEDSDIWALSREKASPTLLLRQTGNQDYPSFSPDGRQMAYISSHIIGLPLGAVQVYQQLWVADFRQARARQWIQDPGGHIEPVWSPVADIICLAVQRGEQFEIFKMRSDGSDLRPLTSGPGSKTRPSWSPDGKKLLTTILRDGRYGLAIVDLESGAIRPYTPFPDRPQAEVRDADWR